LKTLHFKETIVLGNFSHGHQQFVFFLQRSICHRTVATSSPVAIFFFNIIGIKKLIYKISPFFDKFLAAATAVAVDNFCM
jgi:hypothetical protein